MLILFLLHFINIKAKIINRTNSLTLYLSASAIGFNEVMMHLPLFLSKAHKTSNFIFKHQIQLL